MKKAGELHSLEILERLWQEISIDIIGPLSKSNGQDCYDLKTLGLINEQNLV